MEAVRRLISAVNALRESKKIVMELNDKGSMYFFSISVTDRIFPRIFVFIHDDGNVKISIVQAYTKDIDVRFIAPRWAVEQLTDDPFFALQANRPDDCEEEAVSCGEWAGEEELTDIPF